VILPDGRSLRFKYNLFGEVAEVLLPTGGKLQYDYASSSGLPSGNSIFFEYQGQYNLITNIDRVVSERRTYPDGTNLEGSTTYSYGPQTFNGTSYACAEVKGYQGASATGTLLMRQRHFFLATSRYLTGNTGGGAFGTGYSLWSTGIEWRTETLNASGGVVNAVERDWTQRAAVSWTTGYMQEQPGNDNRVNVARRYLDTGSFAKTETFYDTDPQRLRANNVTEVKEYDFGQSTLTRRTVTTYLKNNPDNGSIDYTTDAVYQISLPAQQSVYDSGGAEKARTVYQYDKYINDGNNATLQDPGAATGHDATYGTGKTTRGNPTAVGRWLNPGGVTLYSYSRYDTLGNVISAKDPNGKVSTISYTDNFGDGGNPDAGSGGTYGATFALPTLITSPVPNAGEPQQTAKSQYDFSAGLLTGFKDRNGVITKTEYNDAFNRPTKVIAAKGVAGVETQTAMYYAPQLNPYGVTLAKNDVLTAKDRDGAGDSILRSWTLTDGFGRTIEGWTRHPQGDVKVSMIYDALSRVKQTSNPYRSSETPVYTTTTYDLAGRVTAVTTPDGATVSTAYDGARVMVTDQAQKKRISETDGLGRLLKVWEIRSPDSDTVSLG
jgi:YD repeat-containing protein